MQTTVVRCFSPVPYISDSECHWIEKFEDLSSNTDNIIYFSDGELLKDFTVKIWAWFDKCLKSYCRITWFLLSQKLNEIELWLYVEDFIE